MVSKELLNELQEILQEDYQLLIPDDEIEELGNSLVDSYKVLLDVEI